MQLEFKRENGAPVKTATVKSKGSETETLPLFTNKDAVRGEVRSAALLYDVRSASSSTNPGAEQSSVLGR